MALGRGELIAYPTEAVWGLGCDPYNEEAVASLLAIKRRPAAKGLILVAADASQLAPLRAGLTDAQWRKLVATTRQPTTWLVPNNGTLPLWICGAHDNVAVRLSSHPVIAALCAGFGEPIVSTSANPTGLPPARNELSARRYFRNGIAAYVAGATGGAKQPSRIIDLCSGERLR
ncbi:MAG: Sua5/YciO/YrdC/YwlC family protein [Pseudomonadales bacterium]